MHASTISRSRATVVGALLAAVALLATLFVATPPASANPEGDRVWSAAPDGPGVTVSGSIGADRTQVLPPAPDKTDRDAESLAVPTISPSVAVSYADPGGQYTCEYATLCAWAWDTSRDKWKIFHLYNCHKYALSNWTSQHVTGFNNNQTTGTVARFYGQNGSTQVEPASTAYELRHENRGGFGGWGPVWYIKNC